MLVYNPCGHVKLLFIFFDTWHGHLLEATRRQREKIQLAILNQQQIEKLQLNSFQCNTCNFIGTFAIERSQNASCHHCQNYSALS